MRLIGVIEDSQDARNFASWLLTKDIELRVDQDEGGKSELWVKDEDHLQTAIEEFEAFKKMPDAAQYAAAVQDANRKLRAQEKQRREIQKKQIHVHRISGGMGTAVGPITKTVMILCLLVAILTNFGDRAQLDQGANRVLQFVAVDQPQSLELESRYETTPDAMGLRLASVERFEIWRLFTPMFIHYGIWHFLFNMLMFLQFGRMVEGRYGTLWMAILVLNVAAISNIAQGIAPHEMGGSVPVFSSGILISRFGGLSGVVYGLFGFIVAKQFNDPKSGFFLPQMTIVLLMGWMLFGMLPAAKEMNFHIANWCHGIGFLTGVVMAFVKR